MGWLEQFTSCRKTPEYNSEGIQIPFPPSKDRHSDLNDEEWLWYVYRSWLQYCECEIITIQDSQILSAIFDLTQMDKTHLLSKEQLRIFLNVPPEGPRLAYKYFQLGEKTDQKNNRGELLWQFKTVEVIQLYALMRAYKEISRRT